jgi:hypothetical protein
MIANVVQANFGIQVEVQVILEVPAGLGHVLQGLSGPQSSESSVWMEDNELHIPISLIKLSSNWKPYPRAYHRTPRW